jgi:hypothetical protein
MALNQRAAWLLLALQLAVAGGEGLSKDFSASKLARDLPLLSVSERARGENDFMKLSVLRKKLNRDTGLHQTGRIRQKEMLFAQEIGGLSGELRGLEHPKSVDVETRASAQNTREVKRADAVRQAHLRRHSFLSGVEAIVGEAAEIALVIIAIVVAIVAVICASKMALQSYPKVTKVHDDIPLDAMHEDAQGRSLYGEAPQGEFRALLSPTCTIHLKSDNDLLVDSNADFDADTWADKEIQQEEERRGGPRRRSSAAFDLEDV